MKWPGFPTTKAEFERYLSFKTHHLDALLHLSGFEAKVRAKVTADWSIVKTWQPEVRYAIIGTVTAHDAAAMVRAAKAVVATL